MEFRDDSDRFKIVGCIHVKYVTGFCGFAGILGHIALFTFGIAIFPWDLYELSINITAVTAFMCFLVGGCIAHGLILYGLYKTRFRYMMPSILWQSFLMCMLGITCLIAIGELVSEQGLSSRDETVAKLTICIGPLVFFIQGAILLAITKCRVYIQCKRRHIRNGLPPPIREVIQIRSPMTNKVSIAELSVDNPYMVSETRMP